MRAGPVIDDETLALDEIHKVGPDGEYIHSEHTRQHYKERYYPQLLDRRNYETWAQKGSKTLAERAARQVEGILAQHRAPQLPERVRGQLREIVARSEAAARG